MRNRSHRQEVRTITDYITADTAMPQFFPYPCFLLKMDLSYTARLLYALLLDRTTLSQKNGWQDSEGRTYIVYPVSEIAETLDKGRTAIKSALNELDAAGLLVRERRGFSAPNRLYVKIPQVPVVQFSDHMTAIQPENRPSDSRKSDPHKDGKPTFALDGKPPPNQLTINQLKENQLKGASGEPQESRRRDKHFVAYFLAAFLASFTRCLYRCPKSLEVVFWYWSFCHSYSPCYILLFPFLLGYVYVVLSVSQNNSYIYVDNKLLLYIILYKRGGMFMLHSMRIR